MGFYVHLSVTFACDSNEGVAALAKRHLPAVAERQEDGCREARWFLEALAVRTGENPGPKGGLSTWGTVGNYTSADVFVDVLRPFWTELLTGRIDGGPQDFEHVVVFYEREQSEQAHCYEVAWNGGSLEIRHHALPFAWMQY